MAVTRGDLPAVVNRLPLLRVSVKASIGICCRTS
jgi:hypothetical protein